MACLLFPYSHASGFFSVGMNIGRSGSQYSFGRPMYRLNFEGKACDTKNWKYDERALESACLPVQNGKIIF